MALFLAILYGFPLLVALSNLGLMIRPRRRSDVQFEVMIPARNEAERLPHVLNPLVKQGVAITVYDDGSSDGTADIARGYGVKVVSGGGDLPPGWRGKTFACHQLATRASAEWVIFLDADTIPTEDFRSRLAGLLANSRTPVVTGFTRMIPGAGLEPLYLSWVPWILLATNPFGLVSRSGRGHNRFTNGQFTAWRRDVLREVNPYESVRGEILEDVRIGRLLANRQIAVEVADVTDILAVKMYRDLRGAIDGMSKNSADIVGSPTLSVILAIGLTAYAWGWAFVPGERWALYCLLTLGKAVTDRIVRGPVWLAPFAPISISAAGLTILRSLWWKRRGAIRWKGRTY